MDLFECLEHGCRDNMPQPIADFSGGRRHQHHGEFLFAIDPKISAAAAAPIEISGRAQHAGTDGGAAHGHAPAEAVTLDISSRPQPVQIDLGRHLVRSHELDRFPTDVAVAVERAVLTEHFREVQVIEGRRVDVVAAAVARHAGQLNLYRRVVAVLAKVSVGRVECCLVFTRLRRMERVVAAG